MIWVTQELPKHWVVMSDPGSGLHKNYPNTGLLHLTHDLGYTRTTQTLGCYVHHRIWVTQNYPNTGLLHLTHDLGYTRKLPKHWVVLSDPGSGLHKNYPKHWVVTSNT